MTRHKLCRFTPEGDRCHLWPIRISWGPKASSVWFVTHGWQTGVERCAPHETSEACMPGYRRLFGQTFHLGRLKVKFGPLASRQAGCDDLAPSSVDAQRTVGL
jgi:hypothetical protein